MEIKKKTKMQLMSKIITKKRTKKKKKVTNKSTLKSKKKIKVLLMPVSTQSDHPINPMHVSEDEKDNDEAIIESNEDTPNEEQIMQETEDEEITVNMKSFDDNHENEKDNNNDQKYSRHKRINSGTGKNRLQISFGGKRHIIAAQLLAIKEDVRKILNRKPGTFKEKGEGYLKRAIDVVSTK